MYHHTKLHSCNQESLSAVTLRNCLTNSLKDKGERDALFQEIGFWMNAIKGNHEKWDLRGERMERSEMVREWYWRKSQSHSYQAPNWKISKKKSQLFQQLRSDKYYHLKKLVEMVSRHLVEEVLRSHGIKATVYMTSDHDDVCAWVDFIVETRDLCGMKYAGTNDVVGRRLIEDIFRAHEDGIITDLESSKNRMSLWIDDIPNRRSTLRRKKYTGIDVAVSDNHEYLEEKRGKTQALPGEFIACHNLKDTAMPRLVYAISPVIMAKFLPAYMQQISSRGSVKSDDVLPLFREAAKKAVTTTVKVRTAVQEGAYRAISEYA